MTEVTNQRMLGPWMTLSLVIGGIIGTGIFLLPVALAPLGASVPIGWLVSGIGVMAIAYCASRIVSPEGGGLQSYVEKELGLTVGFLVTWMTWCATWIGIPGGRPRRRHRARADISGAWRATTCGSPSGRCSPSSRSICAGSGWLANSRW